MSATGYATIVADPPWSYPEGFAASVGGRWANGTSAMRRRRLPYPSMTVREISALPIASIAATDCRLFLWTTSRYLGDAFAVLASWGFAYAQTLVWHKTGNPTPFGGSVAPIHAEFVLVATRGRPTRRAALHSSVLAVDTNPAVLRHSQKPDAFLDYFEHVSPGPYLELFARRQRLGWDTWGHEALEHVAIEATA
jgi:N6-adenosine-specific RNA methylase IME4